MLWKETNMITLGVFTTRDGNCYDCQFIPKEKTAQAVGPIPGRVGARGVAYEVGAESEEEARQKLAEEIGQGSFE
jgi:hypothetical protein